MGDASKLPQGAARNSQVYICKTFEIAQPFLGQTRRAYRMGETAEPDVTFFS